MNLVNMMLTHVIIILSTCVQVQPMQIFHDTMDDVFNTGWEFYTGYKNDNTWMECDALGCLSCGVRGWNTSYFWWQCDCTHTPGCISFSFYGTLYRTINFKSHTYDTLTIQFTTAMWTYGSYSSTLWLGYTFSDVFNITTSPDNSKIWTEFNVISPKNDNLDQYIEFQHTIDQIPINATQITVELQMEDTHSFLLIGTEIDEFYLSGRLIPGVTYTPTASPTTSPTIPPTITPTFSPTLSPTQFNSFVYIGFYINYFTANNCNKLLV
eukprot:461776_1